MNERIKLLPSCLVVLTAFALPAFGEDPCLLSTQERELLVRGVINAQLWTPSMVFKTDPRGDVHVRWLRFADRLFIAGAVTAPHLTDAFPQLELPVYELSKLFVGGYTIRLVPLRGTADPLLGVSENQTSATGLCITIVHHRLLEQNKRRSHEQRSKMLAATVAHLQKQLQSTFTKGAQCRGNFVAPFSLENRGVGRIACVGSEGKESFFFWNHCSIAGDVVDVSIGFDNPSSQIGHRVYDRLRRRERSPVRFRL